MTSWPALKNHENSHRGESPPPIVPNAKNQSRGGAKALPGVKPANLIVLCERDGMRKPPWRASTGGG